VAQGGLGLLPSICAFHFEPPFARANRRVGSEIVITSVVMVFVEKFGLVKT